MKSDDSTSISGLIQAWNAGDQRALHRLTPAVYDDMRRIARQFMRRQRAGHTLQTTGLVHDAFVHLMKAEANWRDRGHFFAGLTQIMRRILIDAARARAAQKRGAGAVHVNHFSAVDLDALPAPGCGRATELVALDDALRRLEDIDARKSKVVELRFFGGLTVEETADVLGVSTQTVLRDWRLARAWLAREVEL